MLGVIKPPRTTPTKGIKYSWYPTIVERFFLKWFIGPFSQRWDDRKGESVKQKNDEQRNLLHCLLLESFETYVQDFVWKKFGKITNLALICIPHSWNCTKMLMLIMTDVMNKKNKIPFVASLFWKKKLHTQANEQLEKALIHQD
jgi:hypothetical protein